MTISSTVNRVSYTGNAVTTAFAFGYKFLENADLDVYLDGTLKTITTHYTVTGAGLDNGGTVTFLVAPASPLEVVIVRNPALTQGTDLVENDPLPAESLEDALDKLTIIAQRLDDRVDRSIILNDAVVGTFDLTLPVPQAGYSLVWNATEDGIANSTSDTAADSAAATASAAAAAGSQAAAAVSAGAASVSAAAALASENAAAVSAAAALVSQNAAAASQSAAGISAAAASASEIAAELAETNAAASEAAAAVSEGNAAADAAAVAAALALVSDALVFPWDGGSVADGVISASYDLGALV